MLRPAFRTAQRLYVRSYVTSPSPHRPDQLDQLLSAEGPKVSSIWGNSDEQFSRPPQAPPGSLPPGGRPQWNKQQHRLPPEDIRHYHLHVFSSRNNTILTFTDAIGNPRAWFSSGRCGFKNVQRSGYEAGYQCAVKMFQRIAEEKAKIPNTMKLELVFKGFGFGREALYRALLTTEGDKIRDLVAQLKDTTPIKIGGTKAKKTRRL